MFKRDNIYFIYLLQKNGTNRDKISEWCIQEMIYSSFLIKLAKFDINKRI